MHVDQKNQQTEIRMFFLFSHQPTFYRKKKRKNFCFYSFDCGKLKNPLMWVKSTEGDKGLNPWSYTSNTEDVSGKKKKSE